MARNIKKKKKTKTKKQKTKKTDVLCRRLMLNDIIWSIKKSSNASEEFTLNGFEVICIQLTVQGVAV